MHEDVVPYLTKKQISGEEDEYLTDEQIAELDEAVRQADAGKQWIMMNSKGDWQDVTQNNIH